MQSVINFFIDIGKLKNKKRRGWLLHQIEKSESTASHIFRMAILTWMLGRKKRFNLQRALKMALIHDICEIFTRDETPYDPLLPKRIDSPQSQKTAKKILEKWPKFSLSQKKRKIILKQKRERLALEKLISKLPCNLKEEIRNLWIDFEKGLSREARFTKQIDKAENLLQGLEYWEKYGRIQRDLWIRWAREIFDIPVLIEFEQAIEKKFVQKKTKRKGEIDEILNFLIKIGKLKEIMRKGAILIKAKNPETIAEHSFRVAIMSWVLAEEKRTKLNFEKILKMGLIHDICEVYTGDITLYDKILPKDEKEWPELFDKWPRFSRREKRKIVQKKQKQEKKALRKLIANLPKDLKEEVKDLQAEYQELSSKEARFVKQVNRIETLLQALEYGRESKRPPYKSWWIGTAEKVDDPLLIKFMAELEKKFCKRGEPS